MCPFEMLAVAQLHKNTITLQNAEVHYRSHKSRSLVLILTDMNLVHGLPSYFLKIHFIIILPTTPTLR
jgi:hypothetical protein